MSAQRVDVLVVMEGVARHFRIRGLSNDDKEFADEFLRAFSLVDKARTAVAELMDAAKDLKDVCNRPSAARTRAVAWRRLDKAIACCGETESGAQDANPVDPAYGALTAGDADAARQPVTYEAQP